MDQENAAEGEGGKIHCVERLEFDDKGDEWNQDFCIFFSSFCCLFMVFLNIFEMSWSLADADDDKGCAEGSDDAMEIEKNGSDSREGRSKLSDEEQDQLG